MPSRIRKKDIFYTLCVISLLSISITMGFSLVYAQGPYGPHRPGFGPGMGLQRGYCSQPCSSGMDLQRGMMQEPPYCRMLLDRPDLNLTPKQKDDIKALQIKHMKETLDLRMDLQIKKIELKKLRFAKNPDFNLIKEKLEQISKLQLELQIKRARLQVDADKLLTDDQKDSLYLSPGMSVDIEWEDLMGEEKKTEKND